MDLSLHGLKKVQRRHLTNMLPVCAAADQKFPFPDNHFDVVSTVFMVEHLTPLSLSRFYAEAQRVLRPCGKLVVASDSAFYDNVVHPIERFVRQNRYIPNDPTHINLMNPRQCEAGIRAAGFIPDSRTIHWIAGRWALARFIYRILPQHFTEIAFSTMYIITARKPTVC
jgi:ubiquinone/menaquinone biosynthesis C-methylase UbiE